jgi:hypothetical protein
MSGIASTSGRIHSEFTRLLFLQGHRETDRYFEVSGVQFVQPTSGLFHFHGVMFVLLTTQIESGQHLDKLQNVST